VNANHVIVAVHGLVSHQPCVPMVVFQVSRLTCWLLDIAGLVADDW